MSSYLYRLGRLAAHRACTVITVWLLLLVALGAGAATLGGTLQEDLTIPGTESQRGLDQLDQRFPLLSGVSGQILFVAPEGETVAQHADDVEKVLADVEGVDHVAMLVDPLDTGQEKLLADEGRYALAQVILDVPLDKLPDETIPALEKAAALPDGSALDVHLGGAVFTTTSVAVTPTEGLGVLVALVVLAITFGSMLAAGLPILTAVLGVGATMAGMLMVAQFATITSTTPTLALMIGLAVGIDYALFIVYRHRSQLAQGMTVVESVARATATAGSAVIFAGATVVIALCGLAVAGIPFLTVMGLAAAAVVAVAVVVALTFVPATLALCGERLRPRPGSRTAQRARAHLEGRTPRTLGARWVRIATRLPALTVIASVLVLLALALPAKDLALGLPDNGTKDVGSPVRTTYDLVSDAYGPGMNAPLLVTADIITSTDPLGLVDDLAAELGRVDGVARVQMSTPNPTGDMAVIQITPEHAQADPETADLVRELRSVGPDLEKKYSITDWTVTGQTAVAVDVSQRLSDALLPFGLVVVGLSLVLLTIVFRSIAVPLKATAGYLLSVLAAFGAVTMVFEYGWAADLFNVSKVGPVVSFLPIILMGVLFGLAMDYEVFLVSRMREEYVHTHDAQTSIHTGFAESARVVTAAAVIMIAVFVAFVPHGDSIVKPMAFGLAVGVFVDAFLVRMTLVPAVMALLGDRAWWLPKRLDRALPHLDVEGEGLAHHVDHDTWVAEHGPVVVHGTGVVLDDERGQRLGAPLDLVVRPDTVHLVDGLDRVWRGALLTATTGRLPHSDGTLLVHDRLLPEESAAVRRQSALFTRWPGEAELTALGDDVLLVAVDAVDRDADPHSLAHRIDVLAAVVAARPGRAVVVGTDRAVPLHPDGLSTDPSGGDLSSGVTVSRTSLADQEVVA